jgi:anaerobic selenocysteine-containing dehydrogenase
MEIPLGVYPCDPEMPGGVDQPGQILDDLGGFLRSGPVEELAWWSDHDLEAVGRLAEPMSYEPASDKYQPISWEDAFALVGSTLRGLDSPHHASFYTSGRLSNEATFLYQL